MYVFDVIERKALKTEWVLHVKKLVNKFLLHHNKTKLSNCSGIDMRRSGPFYRQEILHADKCVRMYDENMDIIAFALVKRKRCSSCMYVTFMTSFKKGCGRLLVEHLATFDKFKEKFVVLRSTNEALGFYVHLGFSLFDWLSIEEYVSRGDVPLTDAIRHGHTDLSIIRQMLVQRNWIDRDFYEWPLLLRRITEDTNNRSSKRIRTRDEEQRFRPVANQRL